MLSWPSQPGAPTFCFEVVFDSLRKWKLALETLLLRHDGHTPRAPEPYGAGGPTSRCAEGMEGQWPDHGTPRTTRHGLEGPPSAPLPAALSKSRVGVAPASLGVPCSPRKPAGSPSPAGLRTGCVLGQEPATPCGPSSTLPGELSPNRPNPGSRCPSPDRGRAQASAPGHRGRGRGRVGRAGARWDLRALGTNPSGLGSPPHRGYAASGWRRGAPGPDSLCWGSSRATVSL